MAGSLRTKARCKRNQRGGGLGGSWGYDSASSSSASALTNNPLVYSIGNGCSAAVRPGIVSVSATGLPGMAGGSRRRTRRTSQHGGRYGFVTPDTSYGGAPWGTGLAPSSAIGCEASRTPIPLSGASGSLNVRGGELWSGAGGSREDGAYGLMVPTARYTQLAGANDYITSSAGTHEMINAPLGSAQMNPACLKTGGGRRATKSKKAKRSSKAKTKKAKRSSKAKKAKRSSSSK